MPVIRWQVPLRKGWLLFRLSSGISVTPLGWLGPLPCHPELGPLRGRAFTGTGMPRKAAPVNDRGRFFVLISPWFPVVVVSI